MPETTKSGLVVATRSAPTTSRKTAEKPSAASQPRAQIILPYSEGTWHGRPNYQCRMCSFTTLSKATMHDHLTAHAQGELSHG